MIIARHFELVRLEETTARGYRGKLDNHIAPLTGHVKVGAIGADVLDSFYAELERCRVTAATAGDSPSSMPPLGKVQRAHG